MNKTCYHCGKECDKDFFYIQEKNFCCNGCKTVYEILNEHNLSEFYTLNPSPGIEPDGKNLQQFNFLDTQEVFDKLVDFSDDGYTVITFFIPVIHCTSCIWLLESLPKFHEYVTQSQVNFTKKSLTVTYKSDQYTLSDLAKFLTQLGYKPIISFESAEDKKSIFINRRLMLQLAVAFFCAGNIMLLAFPDYVGADSKWLEGDFKRFFSWLMFLLSLPAVLYSAQDYFISAFKGIEHDNFNIDVPISIGILTLFIRSTYEVVTGIGYGYFDSLAGFIFFLLIGKYFQQSTYNFLSFDRDYKSFYPIAVTKIMNDEEQNIILSELKKGDRILIRNEEIIPADAILIKGDATIDNSFITGESRLIEKKIGDKIFAGGKQIGSAIEVETIKDIDQSYLTKLWNNNAFKKNEGFKIITDRISKKFTLIVLSIAVITGIVWWFIDSSRVFEIVTAVLIVACPCALALSAPFTFGNMMRIMAKRRFYVKDTSTIENIASVDTIVFDKTGTITENETAKITFISDEALHEKEKIAVKSLVKNSNHPLSRILYNQLNNIPTVEVIDFKEISGKGSQGIIDNTTWKLGSASFVETHLDFHINQTKVYVKKDTEIIGYFKIENKYRYSIASVINQLKKRFDLVVLSGDNDSEKENLLKIMSEKTPLLFNQNPQDKLNYIQNLQKTGKKIMMIGDGLNDAGALKQSNVGISVADNINSFSPSCDAILDGKSFKQLPSLLHLSKHAVTLLKTSFVISLLYNIIGLSFAVLGYLSPLVAAILMPLSSISVVVFATFSTYLVGKFEKNP
ncbi:MAG: heavy metal translocating P-type ATPase [Flavobacteriales bacterium]